MITADSAKRDQRFSEIQEILVGRADPEDREILSSFARPVYAAMPDWMALELSVEELANRVEDNFRFFVKEMPPPNQLYKGLPGLHAVVRQSGRDEALSTVRGKLMPQETTIIQTHTPDAPFIFASLKYYLRKAGIRVYSALHPILSVRRQWERIVSIGGPQDEGSKELLCRFRIERIESQERLRRIEHEVFCVLKSVFMAVEDFSVMVNAVRETGPRLRGRSGDAADAKPDREFVEWLVADNYVLMGTLQYRVGADGQPDRVEESATGVFRDSSLPPVVFPGLVEEVEGHLIPEPDDDRIIEIDYCNNASAIYHMEPIDDIVIREWGEDGRLKGALLVMGRFSMGAFTERTARIPLLRERNERLLASSGALRNSHIYRLTRALFNRFPMRELFYTDEAELKTFMHRVVHMTGDDEIAVHFRRTPGYTALLIAFSQLRYSYQTEQDLEHALAEAFGPISFTASEDCRSVHVLVFYFDASRLEHPLELSWARRIAEQLLTTWVDRVYDQLVKAFGEREGRRLFTRYVSDETRSGLYRESTPPEDVPGDLQQLELLDGRLQVAATAKNAEHATLRIYSLQPLGLTATLQMLANLGLKVSGELRIPLDLPEGRRCCLCRYEIEDEPEQIAALVEGQERVAEALRALDEERATDGSLNGLIVNPGLTWREVELLRTVRNHLLQIRPHYNAETVNGVVLRHKAMAAALLHAFKARFDPKLAGDRETAIEETRAEVQRTLDAVRSLTEDEILRGMANLIDCTLRTNYFQRPDRPVIALKVASGKVEGMPSPRPMFEIYVHSRLLEGIHLRGGPVARGGIRWSDRHDDFRTEILGLMKTQMVKNSIIVPVGSKGGFVLKGTLPGRPAIGPYLADRYRQFISGLLDVTDNMLDGNVIHPPEVVRHDGEDPYFVVAADKGTAHLSDTANAVSAQYGFWLGDAFASGGSVGYDHKKVGITARGTWECVKHHFWNLGTDVQKDPFTVAGIGDMAGDVFGNGMLSSRAMRLVAAFNHLHILIDPDPDPELSFKERERLFRLPRSTWRDYDTSLISRGGGVFDRSAKAIPLSPEARALLDIEGEVASGEEVIRRILKLHVDLLYNGGIGTYVKATDEDHADVGDRANDRVRVDATDLRAKVVGEGGNLGLTQKARLEYWAGGGLVNTDAVDNSGGVDMSDHEVNIKILMGLLIKKGRLEGGRVRDQLFMDLTEDVAALVLGDNEAQARALTLDNLRSVTRYEEFVGLIDDMAGAGILNRADEDVPRRAQLLESPQRERGLARPLLAVILGHVKMWGFDMILETDLPDSPTGAPFLTEYFPERLRASYAEFFPEHPLRREIVATAAVNHLINSAGVTFLSRVMNETGSGLAEVVAGYLDADRGSGAPELRRQVLGAGWSAEAAHRALLEIEDALESHVRATLAGESPDARQALDPIREKLGL